MKKNIIYLLLYSSYILSLSGCLKVTYPKEHLTESLVELCKKEYSLSVQVQVKGKTIGVYLPLNRLLDEEKTQLYPESAEKITNASICLQRVILSTDADLDFYLLIAADLETGLQFSIIGYIQDLKLVRIMNISRNEYFKRTIRNISFNPLVFLVKDKKDFLSEEITLPKFLSLQIVNRIKLLKNKDKAISLKSVQGYFQDSEFNIRINSNSPYSLIHPDVLKIIHKVIDIYKFKDYKAIHLSYLPEDIEIRISPEELNMIK